MNETERIEQQIQSICRGASTEVLLAMSEMLKEIKSQAATIAQLQQHIATIEAETKGWIDDLVAAGGARKIVPLDHILAVIQSRAADQDSSHQS